MFNSYICKSLRHFTLIRTSPKHKFLKMLSTSSKEFEAEKPISENVDQGSFVVNYLVNSIGVSLEKAISASRHLKFDKPDKPDAVVSLLMNKGFTQTQVRKLIFNFPRIFVYSPKKSLLEKIDFFESKGFSRSDVPAVLLGVPYIFTRSLEKYIIPTFNSLKELLGCENKVIVAVKRCPMILRNLQSRVVPNIEILREVGVPDARIAYFLRDKPFLFTKRTDRFKESVEEVKNMGFDLKTATFISGVSVFSSLSRTTWKEKIEVYNRWGCSEDEVLMAFKRYPWCMMASKAKLEGIMDILVNEIGLETSKVLRCPNLLSASLNKRIIPRHSMYQVLLSKGLIKEQSMITIISMTEESFLKKFVLRYEKEVPDLLKLYEEMLEI